MIKFIVYLPGKTAADPVEIVRVSENADLAVLRRKNGAEPMSGLRLADAPPAPGDEIIIMGYPTGLRSMLAQSRAARLFRPANRFTSRRWPTDVALEQ